MQQEKYNYSRCEISFKVFNGGIININHARGVEISSQPDFPRFFPDFFPDIKTVDISTVVILVVIFLLLFFRPV